ncbi:hypothetical protein D3C76_1699870 [compost metagenome]
MDYEKEVTVNDIHRITKKGRVSNKKLVKHWDDNGIEYLKCDTCSKRYKVNYDDRDRVIRGDFAF